MDDCKIVDSLIEECHSFVRSGMDISAYCGGGSEWLQFVMEEQGAVLRSLFHQAMRVVREHIEAEIAAAHKTNKRRMDDEMDSAGFAIVKRVKTSWNGVTPVVCIDE